jgi:Sec-independent protein secretion pathway component TatC
MSKKLISIIATVFIISGFLFGFVTQSVNAVTNDEMTVEQLKAMIQQLQVQIAQLYEQLNRELKVNHNLGVIILIKI